MSPVVDRVEADEFFAQTYVASSHNVVELILAQSDEIKRLVMADAPSHRVVHERAKLMMSRPAARRMPLIAYAIVFKRRRDAAAVPLLSQFVRSLPDGEIEAALSPWHPFGYVVDALCRITGMPPKDPRRAVFAERRAIADAAERWYAQQTATRPTPQLCPKCHRTVDAGKKFCTACGTRIAP